jgi:3-methyladenine DNA glycosylase AlkC
MKPDFTAAEIQSAQEILHDLQANHLTEGIGRLRALKDSIYTAIPEKQRISRGITWVVERISHLFTQVCNDDEIMRWTAQTLFDHLQKTDLLLGAPIFLMADYGMRHPAQVFTFFEKAAASQDWVVREFAAGAFRKVIGQNKVLVQAFLAQAAQAAGPNLRRFASETLRPVVLNKWINQEPEYSLQVLRLMFHEAHPYPRTSVGNNLSDLSRRQPELIFSLVQELVASGDSNSAWIAHRACRNLVKKQPGRVMDALGVDAYHYKDRNFTRN